MKVCAKCNTEKPESEFYAHGGYTCKECANKRAKINYRKNIVHIKNRNSEYRKSRIKERNEYQARHRKTNKAWWDNWYKSGRQKLSNTYIRQLLHNSGVKNADISDDDVENKRTDILLKRLNRTLAKSGFKVCVHCHFKKPLKLFTKNKFTWKGIVKYSIRNICESCSSKRIKIYKYKKQNAC